jgi:lipopolysaccharide/colanic/teichoic acid biosynthesis glycosyltransferase
VRSTKSYLSQMILMGIDLLAIYLSIAFAYGLRVFFDEWITAPFHHSLELYVENVLFYLIVLVTFFNENIYKYRYDFWEETRHILKALVISFVILLAVLALSKSVESYSRFVLLFSFLAMGLFIPVMKNITKKLLFKWSLWKREAQVYGNDSYIKDEIFGNPYLGYVHSDHIHAQTTFIDTQNISANELQKCLDLNLQEKKEVLFIPLLQSYNFANARIIELSNARKNLIVLENALLKKRNILTKKTSDLFLSLLLFPILVFLFMIIIALMKREEPKGKIFFKQKRMGRNGHEFICYKFRSMYEDGDAILKAYLKEHPEEIVCYDKYHKYKNDPRITKIGRILRKTSLDELPQIINVLGGEMSLIGPRPYMPSEKEKIGEKLDMVLAVKPGITGLWQVSGRSEVDFNSRVDMDVWYTRNWNLWLDLVILVKTIKVVLFRDGAH